MGCFFLLLLLNVYTNCILTRGANAANKVCENGAIEVVVTVDAKNLGIKTIVIGGKKCMRQEISWWPWKVHKIVQKIDQRQWKLKRCGVKTSRSCCLYLSTFNRSNWEKSTIRFSVWATVDVKSSGLETKWLESFKLKEVRLKKLEHENFGLTGRRFKSTHLKNWT